MAQSLAALKREQSQGEEEVRHADDPSFFFGKTPYQAPGNIAPEFPKQQPRQSEFESETTVSSGVPHFLAQTIDVGTAAGLQPLSTVGTVQSSPDDAGFQESWAAAEKLKAIETERQQYPQDINKDLPTEIAWSFGSRHRLPTVKNVIAQFRRDQMPESQIVDKLIQLSEGGAKNAAQITLEKLQEIYPPETRKVQSPAVQKASDFHFSGIPQTPLTKYANSPPRKSLGPALPKEHVHISSAETPSEEFLRASTIHTDFAVIPPVTPDNPQQLPQLQKDFPHTYSGTEVDQKWADIMKLTWFLYCRCLCFYSLWWINFLKFLYSDFSGIFCTSLT